MTFSCVHINTRVHTINAKSINLDFFHLSSVVFVFIQCHTQNVAVTPFSRENRHSNITYINWQELRRNKSESCYSGTPFLPSSFSFWVRALKKLNTLKRTDDRNEIEKKFIIYDCHRTSYSALRIISNGFFWARA